MKLANCGPGIFTSCEPHTGGAEAIGAGTGRLAGSDAAADADAPTAGSLTEAALDDKAAALVDEDEADTGERDRDRAR